MIPVARPDLSGNEAAYVAECVSTSWVSSAGRFIPRFEDEFAAFCGSRFAVATNNGTTALHLALLGIGIGPGDEVIVPALTYIASANAVSYCGATPVFVDVDPSTLCLDPVEVERAITGRTRAVMAVHLYGRPADMVTLGRIASAAGIAVVEDAAEAHGATVGGRRVGSLGHVGTFSFFGNKIFTTGEGGAVTTDDEEVADRMRLLRGQGMDPQRRYWFPVVGYNYRMTNIEAALGCAQLERAEEMLARRGQIAAWYDELLVEVPGVRTLGTHPGTVAVNWLFTILTAMSAQARDQVMLAMARDGVETRPVFHPLPTLPPYAGVGRRFPVSERSAAGGLSLPTYVGLSRTDVEQVVSALSRAMSEVLVSA